METRQASAVSLWDDALPGFVLMSRVVVALMAVLLVVMPWSEQYSGLDNFPHGQDTELGLFGFLTMMGLALLLARSCSRAFSALLVIVFVVLGVAGGLGLAECAHRVSPSMATGGSLPRGAPGAFSLPLQI